jgi:diaminohydroxyphosphoribosylaminopyrimidine deaminase/5-amino-6-(5-phosphoribosylamino)uracil reductase
MLEKHEGQDSASNGAGGLEQIRAAAAIGLSEAREVGPVKRPRVLIHYAQTLDGRIATKSGSSQWISGKSALQFAHELRATHDAVMVGVGTAVRDNPRLTVRFAEGPDPIKVVVDSRLRTPDSANLLQETPRRTIFLTTAAASEADQARIQGSGARVIVVEADRFGRVDLRAGLAALARLNIRSLMVEGGARIVTSLLREHLADRLVICMAPIVLGRGVDAVGDLGIAQLGKALGLRDVHIRRLGEDLVVSGDLVTERQAEAWSPGNVHPEPTLAASARLPTRHGAFELHAYEVGGIEHPVLTFGDLSGEPAPLIRLHSECLTGEAFGSLRCDCGEQLDEGLAMIAREGRGGLLYLRQEGRGIGLVNKIRAYHFQDLGLDTVEANLALGLPADGRDYRTAAAVLRTLGLERIRLITNNPSKQLGLESCGIAVVERVPLQPTVNEVNTPYLQTKVAKMGHVLSLARQ